MEKKGWREERQAGGTMRAKRKELKRKLWKRTGSMVRQKTE